MLLVGGCDRPTASLPFDWPELAAAEHDWGLDRLAPATATLVTRLAVGPDRKREDRWQFELSGPTDGRIVHEMNWTGRRLGRRQEREEAVIEAGRVRTQTLGPEFVDWPDDRRWRELMARPGTDWAGLLRRLGERATVKQQAKDPGGAVLSARLAGAGDGWRAELTWAAQRTVAK